MSEILLKMKVFLQLQIIQLVKEGITEQYLQKKYQTTATIKEPNWAAVTAKPISSIESNHLRTSWSASKLRLRPSSSWRRRPSFSVWRKIKLTLAFRKNTFLRFCCFLTWWPDLDSSKIWLVDQIFFELQWLMNWPVDK